MEKEFVPYKQALELKELGFNQPCFGYYTGDKKHLQLRPNMGRINEPSDDVPTAPTFSQAFRWFREKYGLIGYIQTSYVTHEVVNNRNIPCTPRIEFTFGITNTIGKNIFSSFKQGSLKTYEEAELEGLKKLIEIFKQK